ncbi:histidine kinase [Desulfovibrio aerotolerans]|uniref:histidine kinase n=2 Tax=Solidesulfovibrio aerotolerans TaxID=295255 RepID=A0A7C9ILG9_9BACT|nr:histidine kinase [Solidesulfovibrio aerotolerans]
MTRQELGTKCAPPQRLGVNAVDLEKQKLSQHICSSYFDFFPLSIVVINSCRQIVFSNKAFLDVLGVKDIGSFLGERPGEAMGCIYASVEEAGCGTSEYCRECGALKAILDSMINNSKSKQDCQLLVKEDDETRARDLRIFVSPWKVEDTMYYVMSLVDIAEEKRREMLERIFFHDILNAAGGAKGLVDILMDEVPDEAKEFVILAQASLFGLVEEIRKQKQLLALEKNEYTISMITLQGAELIQKVANEYRTHPVAVGKRIVIAPDSVNVSISSDYALLMRVLVNMTLNALEATSEGGSVTLGLKDDGDFATFWVANAKVMPEAVRVQIFKRSFSTKGTGRGLGTYSIKLLTENYLGGEVGFTSEEPAGTRFWVKIPKYHA